MESLLEVNHVSISYKVGDFRNIGLKEYPKVKEDIRDFYIERESVTKNNREVYFKGILRSKEYKF